MGADGPGIVRLRCSVKKYEWGKVGKESGVARLYANNSGETINADETYAEFWMGTHGSGPSYAVLPAQVNGELRNGDLGRIDAGKRNYCDLVSLKDWIEQNPSVLGDKVLQKWGPNLPFLFKVILKILTFVWYYQYVSEIFIFFLGLWVFTYSVICSLLKLFSSFLVIMHHSIRR